MAWLLYARLSLMMLLQYAVWGAWLPVAGRYLTAPLEIGGLGFTGGQVGMILGFAGSIGAVAAPFIAGQFADRYFSTERVLSALLIVGGIIKWITASQTSYASWMWLSIAYGIVFMPTLALSNSLAFAHMPERKSFPYVRVWGTIGWIIASWSFSWLFLQQNLRWTPFPPFLQGEEVPKVVEQLANALRYSGGISIAYGLFALTLPHTPPKRDAVEPLAFLKAFGLLRNPSFALLMIICLPISTIHQVFFIQMPNFLPEVGVMDMAIGPMMTIAQFSEILILPTLALMLPLIGFRWALVLGCLAYAVRFYLCTQSLYLNYVMLSLLFHGVCYAYFFATAFIYVDRVAPPDVRHSAQTLIGILILGGGPVLGGWLSGYLQESYTDHNGVVDYGRLWTVLSMIGFASAVAIGLFFREKRERESGASLQAEPA